VTPEALSLVVAGVALLVTAAWLRRRSRRGLTSEVPDLRAHAAGMATGSVVFAVLGLASLGWGGVEGVTNFIAQRRRELVERVQLRCVDRSFGAGQPTPGRVEIANRSAQPLRVSLSDVAAGRPTHPRLILDPSDEQRGASVTVTAPSVVLGAGESRMVEFSVASDGPCARPALLHFVFEPLEWSWSCDGLDVKSIIGPAEGGWELGVRTWCPFVP